MRLAVPSGRRRAGVLERQVYLPSVDDTLFLGEVQDGLRVIEIEIGEPEVDLAAPIGNRFSVRGIQQ